MKILVTGGAGFIGSNLVDELIKQNHQVSIVDNLSTGKKINVNPRARFYKTNICNKKKLAQIFKKEKPQAVFHLAAQINVRKSVEAPIVDAKTNILGSLNLIKNCQKIKGFKKFIFSSSGGAIYGDAKKIPTPEQAPTNPSSPYGVAKLAVEKYLATTSLPWIALRYANVYGPRHEAGVIAIFINYLKNNKPCIIFGDGKQTRDYVNVKDVVRANILSLKTNVKNKAINIGTGKETSVNQLIKLIALNTKTKHIKAKPGEVRRSCLKIKKAQHLLGWQAQVKLKQGIKQLV